MTGSSTVRAITAAFSTISLMLSKPKSGNPRASEVKITPGMTASVDIRSNSRSVLNYLLKPVHKTLDESLKER